MCKKLDSLLAAAGISLPDQQKQQLLGYVAMLDKWNKAYNLTSVRDPQQMLVRHIMDSIVVNAHLTGSRFIDVGTGPGLPGIPLAIVRPDAHFTLLDSLGKRVRFLRQVQHELGLNNIEPVQSRVEEFVAEPPFDGVISRALLHCKTCWLGVTICQPKGRGVLCAERSLPARRVGPVARRGFSGVGGAFAGT